MRRREIAPQFFNHPGLIRCSPLARLLFAGLWCVADREGRLENKPDHLKIEIFPDQKADVPKLLRELVETAEVVVPYRVSDQQLLWIPGFKKWQRFHPKEAPSTLPEYESWKGEPFHDEPLVNRAGPSGPSGPSGPTGSTELIANAISSIREANPTRQVFDAWAETLGGATRSLTEARKKKITARLRTYPVEDVIDAVRGWQNDPWADRVNQNDITQLLRSDEQCEKFRDLWRNGPPQSRAPSTNPVSREIQGFTAFADAEARGEF